MASFEGIFELLNSPELTAAIASSPHLQADAAIIGDDFVKLGNDIKIFVNRLTPIIQAAQKLK